MKRGTAIRGWIGMIAWAIALDVCAAPPATTATTLQIPQTAQHSTGQGGLNVGGGATLSLSTITNAGKALQGACPDGTILKQIKATGEFVCVTARCANPSDYFFGIDSSGNPICRSSCAVGEFLVRVGSNLECHDLSWLINNSATFRSQFDTEISSRLFLSSCGAGSLLQGFNASGTPICVSIASIIAQACSTCGGTGGGGGGTSTSSTTSTTGYATSTSTTSTTLSAIHQGCCMGGSLCGGAPTVSQCRFPDTVVNISAACDQPVCWAPNNACSTQYCPATPTPTPITHPTCSGQKPACGGLVQMDCCMNGSYCDPVAQLCWSPSISQQYGCCAVPTPTPSASCPSGKHLAVAGQDYPLGASAGCLKQGNFYIINGSSSLAQNCACNNSTGGNGPNLCCNNGTTGGGTGGIGSGTVGSGAAGSGTVGAPSAGTIGLPK